MHGALKRILSLVLILTLTVNVLAGCGGSATSGTEVASADVIEDEIIEDDFIEESYISDEYITEEYIQDNLIYEDGIYECYIDDEIISDVYIIETVVGQHTEEELREQLPEELDDYDIDWPKVIAKFAVGTSIIIAVGVIGHVTKGSSYYVFATPATVAKDALAAGAIAAATNVVIQSAVDGEISEKAKKYAIEGFADGYMWGAIASVLKVAAKDFIRPSELTFADGITRKIQLDGSVLNDAGEIIGHAYYEKAGIYLLEEASEKGTTTAVQLFDTAGKQIVANATNAVALKTLPANAVLQLGEGAAAETCWTDDLGNIFRKGNDLLPNMQYTLNGYEYVTDSAGRQVKTIAKSLQLSKNSGRLHIKDAMDAIGKGYAESADERGHIIADMFGGDNSMANMVSMDGHLNKGDYKSLEMIWKKALEAKQKVEVEINMSYVGDSYRPSAFNIIYKIGGELQDPVTFINVAQ